MVEEFPASCFAAFLLELIFSFVSILRVPLSPLLEHGVLMLGRLAPDLIIVFANDDNEGAA